MHRAGTLSPQRDAAPSRSASRSTPAKVATRPVGIVEAALLAKDMKKDDTHHRMFRKTVADATHLVTRIA